MAVVDYDPSSHCFKTRMLYNYEQDDQRQMFLQQTFLPQVSYLKIITSFQLLANTYNELNSSLCTSKSVLTLILLTAKLFSSSQQGDCQKIRTIINQIRVQTNALVGMGLTFQ